MLKKFENFDSNKNDDNFIIISRPSGEIVKTKKDVMDKLLMTNMIVKNDDDDSLQTGVPNHYFCVDAELDQIKKFFLKNDEKHQFIENFVLRFCGDRTKWKINHDNSIDISWTVPLSNRGLSEIPYKFGYVGGSFYCDENYLINLKNSPDYIANIFNCSSNKIYSLSGSPYVVGHYSCNFNNLQNLDGIKGEMETIDARCNKITRIDYRDIKKTLKLDISGNSLINLDGIYQLKELKSLNCSDNILDDVSEISELRNLKEIFIGENPKIKKLPPLPKSLEIISCRKCGLKYINDIEELPNLKSLYCGDNLFEDDYITYLRGYCRSNKIMLNNDKSR